MSIDRRNSDFDPAKEAASFTVLPDNTGLQWDFWGGLTHYRYLHTVNSADGTPAIGLYKFAENQLILDNTQPTSTLDRLNRLCRFAQVAEYVAPTSTLTSSLKEIVAARIDREVGEVYNQMMALGKNMRALQSMRKALTSETSTPPYSGSLTPAS